MQQITAQELREKIARGDEFLLLDVREPSEYAEYNINGKLLPLAGILAGNVQEIEDWKEKEVVVHCRSGARSSNACMILENMGFQNVNNLVGGVLAWAATES